MDGKGDYGLNSHRRPKLLILQMSPIQYYAPIYQSLAQRGRIKVAQELLGEHFWGYVVTDR
jgi:hypothetical protein